jgi:hypothetical protein
MAPRVRALVALLTHVSAEAETEVLNGRRVVVWSNCTRGARVCCILQVSGSIRDSAFPIAEASLGSAERTSRGPAVPGMDQRARGSLRDCDPPSASEGLALVVDVTTSNPQSRALWRLVA